MINSDFQHPTHLPKSIMINQVQVVFKLVKKLVPCYFGTRAYLLPLYMLERHLLTNHTAMKVNPELILQALFRTCFVQE